MPFFNYNQFTGRLKTSTNLQPLYPIKSEPTIIYDSVKTKPVTVTPKANYCTEKPRTLSPQIWAKFKHYQNALNADVPVYIAGGRKDKALVLFTAAYIGICTVQSAVFIAKECLNII
ncbi:hypothetical protein PUN28_018491 [Cardiocondyla obscurior]|uniref:Uncharacterized protein n=1 Tax=Cardiocondyla obscurior TaxID=286306 RepID=A0AAW2EE20_9HYME